MAETEERSPWPWVVVALGLLAFIAAVFFLTRPAELAPGRDGDTIIIQPEPGRSGEGPSQDVDVDQDGPSGREPSATETAPPGSAPAEPGPAQPAQPRGSAPSTAPANEPAPQDGTSLNTPGNRPAGGEPTQEQQATPVSVEMGEWFVRLDPATVPPGRTRFRVRNVGSITHGFEIEGQGVHEQSERLGPGESAVVVTDLGPGEYVVYCYVGNHRQRGMETRLQVTEE